MFGLFKKLDPNLTVVQNEKETWFRDTYAMWSHISCENFRYIGGCNNSKELSGDIKFILGRDWGIKNKDECSETISFLMYPNDDRAERAWDLCRVFQLYAMGYMSGFYTRAEINAESEKVAKILQKEYSSWEDLCECYIAGYKEWAEEVFGEDAQEKIDDRIQAYNELKALPNGPYKTDWNLKF